MFKKSVSTILIIAFLNLLGCASIQSFTVSEYKQIEEKDKPAKIHIITKSGQEYHFREPVIIFERDTLHVKGKVTTSSKQSRFRTEEEVDSYFALSDIESIKSETTIFSGGSFIILLAICGGIYLVIYGLTSGMKWSSQ